MDQSSNTQAMGNDGQSQPAQADDPSSQFAPNILLRRDVRTPRTDGLLRNLELSLGSIS